MKHLGAGLFLLVSVVACAHQGGGAGVPDTSGGGVRGVFAGQQIAEALAAFIQARESYLRALTDLKPKLTDLAAKVPEHDHLDPIDKYREIVRARMFDDVAPPV